ncbi:unnamed protein product [Vitrella brassicaformis CCMP3155]|uniref:Uncharacterized protein n=1 Tax=Vitrella brassicaformis (strain CCMP3155) TaxID=1169540 RepID=A0A0G4EGC8_VITBC|nr:unnamed protein product [Vitrella brassicaformis CCMP3155]|eukprot:CEL94747.1 unnamed protein product [Vitrella brassicaformis CCMP3155]
MSHDREEATAEQSSKCESRASAIHSSPPPPLLPTFLSLCALLPVLSSAVRHRPPNIAFRSTFDPTFYSADPKFRYEVQDLIKIYGRLAEQTADWSTAVRTRRAGSVMGGGTPPRWEALFDEKPVLSKRSFKACVQQLPFRWPEEAKFPFYLLYSYEKGFSREPDSPELRQRVNDAAWKEPIRDEALEALFFSLAGDKLYLRKEDVSRQLQSWATRHAERRRQLQTHQLNQPSMGNELRSWDGSQRPSGQLLTGLNLSPPWLGGARDGGGRGPGLLERLGLRKDRSGEVDWPVFKQHVDMAAMQMDENSGDAREADDSRRKR